LSVIADFDHCADRIGSELKSALGSDLSQAVAMANSIKVDIQNRSESDLQTLLPNRLTACRTLYARLKSRWAESGVREAAWLDFVEACRDAATDYDVIAVQRAVFWQLIRAGDYPPDEVSRLLAYALSGVEFYITQVRLWLGDITDSQVTWPPPASDAGLTEDQLLTLCARILTQTPNPGHHIVWIAFNRTGLGGSNREVGPVSFWNCEWVRSVLEHQGPNLDELPDELRNTDGYFRYQDLPEDRDVMLVRVDLGNGAFTDPVRLAAEQAEAVVALAGFRIGKVVGVGSMVIWHSSTVESEAPAHSARLGEMMT
jgi:hypothetical protein